MQHININITWFHSQTPFTMFHGKYTPILQFLTKQNTIYILYLVQYLWYLSKHRISYSCSYFSEYYRDQEGDKNFKGRQINSLSIWS